MNDLPHHLPDFRAIGARSARLATRFLVSVPNLGISLRSTAALMRSPPKEGPRDFFLQLLRAPLSLQHIAVGGGFLGQIKLKPMCCTNFIFNFQCHTRVFF